MKITAGAKVRWLGYGKDRNPAGMLSPGVIYEVLDIDCGLSDEFVTVSTDNVTLWQTVRTDELEVVTPSDDMFYGKGKTYRDEVLRTCTPGFLADFEKVVSCAALGLAGETGEVVDLIKKYLHHGVQLDKEKVIKEISDVRWYLELMAHAMGVSMDDVERANAVKLRKRYPNGFNTADSVERKDEKAGK